MKECKYQKFSDIWPNKCKKFWKRRRQRKCKDVSTCKDFRPTIMAVIMRVLRKGKKVTLCKDCKHLEITLPYGECSKHLRVVSPDDSCPDAEPRGYSK